MSTSRELSLRKALKEALMKYRLSTKATLRGWRAALIGLLLICVATISGCGSSSNHSPEPQQVTVDASLMVKPSLTKQLLSVLSE